MGQKIITVTNCDRCPEQESRDGNYGTALPIKWHTVSTESTDLGRSIAKQYILCPKCYAVVKEKLEHIAYTKGKVDVNE